jgi:hypothetical protein
MNCSHMEFQIFFALNTNPTDVTFELGFYLFMNIGDMFFQNRLLFKFGWALVALILGFA